MSNAGSAVGTALGIAAPCLAIILWFAATYSYRKEKKLLVSTVLEQLKPSYVSTQEVIPTDDYVVLAKQLEHDSPNSTTDFIIPALRDPGTTIQQWCHCFFRSPSRLAHMSCFRNMSPVLAILTLCLSPSVLRPPLLSSFCAAVQSTFQAAVCRLCMPAHIADCSKMTITRPSTVTSNNWKCFTQRCTCNATQRFHSCCCDGCRRQPSGPLISAWCY